MLISTDAGKAGRANSRDTNKAKAVLRRAGLLPQRQRGMSGSQAVALKERFIVSSDGYGGIAFRCTEVDPGKLSVEATKALVEAGYCVRESVVLSGGRWYSTGQLQARLEEE